MRNEKTKGVKSKMMESILPQILNGLVMGAVYSLMAAGLALIYGIMRIVNFAHGALYMLGGYAGYFIWALTGLDPVSTTLLAMLTVFMVGALIEKIIFRPIRSRTREWKSSSVIITLGLLIFLQNLALVVFGPFWFGRPYYFKGSIMIAGMPYGIERIVYFAFSMLVILSLWFFIHKTRIGTALRSVSQNADAAELVGIDIDKIYLLTLGLGAALAAGAGSLLIPLTLVYPTVGYLPGLKAFAVVVLGGLGNISGAILSGIILGIAEALGALFFGSFYKDVVAFIIIIIIMMIRPTGLFGTRTKL